MITYSLEIGHFMQYKSDSLCIVMVCVLIFWLGHEFVT